MELAIIRSTKDEFLDQVKIIIFRFSDVSSDLILDACALAVFFESQRASGY